MVRNYVFPDVGKPIANHKQTKMAETELSANNNEVMASDCADKMDIVEPEAKKRKLDVPEKEPEYKLEERLNGILCCAVCLDLPPLAVFQVGSVCQKLDSCLGVF